MLAGERLLLCALFFLSYCGCTFSVVLRCCRYETERYANEYEHEHEHEAQPEGAETIDKFVVPEGVGKRKLAKLMAKEEKRRQREALEAQRRATREREDAEFQVALGVCMCVGFLR
jgi:type II secretory pathway component HofQ